MGKEARRKKSKRIRYLRRLAETDSKKFAREWEKRLSSWLYLIRENAGVLLDHNDDHVPAVFSVVDEAMDLLKECGAEMFKKYGKETFGLLSSECCRAFSFHAGRELFRLSQWHKLLEQVRLER
jgi:hypothetical protein